MKKAITLALVFVLALSLLTACGTGDNGGTGSTGGNSNTPGTSQGANNNADTNEIYAISKDKVNALSWTDESEKEAVIAEIPEEILYAIGELSYCNIQKYPFDGWKYTLAILTNNTDSAGDLEKLTDYYESVGATVKKKGNSSVYYVVAFDYAESVDVTTLGSTIQIQFSIVKK
ncbi:MAG: hypothetical protein LBQ48_05680 [Oscillospiraceae bacterium]|jgi:hypothetical protein|nr:hypothetical protein [Oscillospiraceae bacterium]